MTNIDSFNVVERWEGLVGGSCPHKRTHKTFRGCVEEEVKLIEEGKFVADLYDFWGDEEGNEK